MLFRVLHHNNCFDGACSASIFTRFHRECVGGAEGYEYVGLQHGPGGGVGDEVFGPGENAIVDFKYSRSPKLTWWFDHHQSAFMTPEDRAAYLVGQRGELALRQFFDPEFISCTSFIAAVGKTRFGFDVSQLGELLYWADIIDGARFADAKQAVEMDAPAMKLALVIENTQDPGFIPRLIPMLTEMPMAELLAQPFVQSCVAPLLARHVSSMSLIRERAAMHEGVVFFDLADQEVEGLNKFIPYYYFPEATYTISVTRSSARVKISVGTNPWTPLPAEKLVNLAAICERFGGGGHARVGAISFRPDELTRGREVAAGIVDELRAAEQR